MRYTARVLASQAVHGARAQLNLGTGFVARELKDNGYGHVILTRCVRLGSFLSLTPRKRPSDRTHPIDFKKHGGAIIELPLFPAGWIGGAWSQWFVGRGWIELDAIPGELGPCSSVRLLMPNAAQLQEARTKLKALPIYPEFD